MGRVKESSIGKIRLPNTSCNAKMPDVRTYHNSHYCDTCCKSDVCMYCDNTMRMIEEITAMTKVEGVFLNIEPSCQKWVGKAAISRGITGGDDSELCISRET